MSDTRNTEVTVKWASGSDTTYLRTADELLTLVGDLTEIEYAPAWTSFTVVALTATPCGLCCSRYHSTDDHGPF